MTRLPGVKPIGHNGTLTARAFVLWIQDMGAQLRPGWQSHWHDRLVRLVPAEAMLGAEQAALERAASLKQPVSTALILRSELSIAMRTAGSARAADRALKLAEASYRQRADIYPTSRTASIANFARAVWLSGDHARGQRLLAEAMESFQSVNNPGENLIAPALFHLTAGDPEAAAALLREGGTSALQHRYAFNRPALEAIAAGLIACERSALAIGLAPLLGHPGLPEHLSFIARMLLARGSDPGPAIQASQNYADQIYAHLLSDVSEADHAATAASMLDWLGARSTWDRTAHRVLMHLSTIDPDAAAALFQAHRLIETLHATPSEALIMVAARSGARDAALECLSRIDNVKAMGTHLSILVATPSDQLDAVADSLAAHAEHIDADGAVVQALAARGLAQIHHGQDRQGRKTLAAARRQLSKVKTRAYPFSRDSVLRWIVKQEAAAGLPEEAVSTSKKVRGNVRQQACVVAARRFAQGGDLAGAQLSLLHGGGEGEIELVIAATDVLMLAVRDRLPYGPIRVL